jgi:hypothetical protein
MSFTGKNILYWEKCLKSFFSRQDVSWLNLAENETDSFLSYAFEQGVQPLFYYLLKLSQRDNYPSSIKKKLDTSLLQYTVLQALIEKETKILLNLFLENNIESLLLKGFPLSYTYYSSTNLRPFSDVDILIRKEAFPKLLGAMEKSGYQKIESISGETIAHQMVFYKVINENLKVYFDIHWAISNIPIFSDLFLFDELWKNKKLVPEISKNAYTLNICDSLLFACVHRASHSHEERLIWLYDIHLLTEKLTKEETEEIFSFAKEKQITKILSEALTKSRDWFNTKIFGNLLDKLNETSSYEPSEVFLEAKLTRLDIFLSNVKHLEKRKRLLFLLEALFPPPSYMLNKYKTSNKFLLPWLYVWRLLSGLRKWFSPLK